MRPNAPHFPQRTVCGTIYQRSLLFRHIFKLCPWTRHSNELRGDIWTIALPVKRVAFEKVDCPKDFFSSFVNFFDSFLHENCTFTNKLSWYGVEHYKRIARLILYIPNYAMKFLIQFVSLLFILTCNLRAILAIFQVMFSSKIKFSITLLARKTEFFPIYIYEYVVWEGTLFRYL